jgi:uncharacterized membrane protein YozB (DUF420 family)
VLTAENVILALKVAVVAVTLLLVASLLAVARGNYRLHGRINKVFFALTLLALIGLEVVARILYPDMFEDYFTRTDSWPALRTHLAFSLPAALLLPLMLYTGLKRRRSVHVSLAMLFLLLWAGTFVTGVFFLPHSTGP